VQELEAGTANNVTQALKDLLQLRGLNVINMVGLATDGTAVMHGHVNGVATQ